MKKLTSIALSLVMAVSFAACAGNADAKSAPEKQPSNLPTAASSTQIPNPFVACKTIAEAEKIAGFSFLLPEKMPKDYTQTSIEAIPNQMIQALYTNQGQQTLIRKAKASGDISGDYTQYTQNSKITVNGLTINIRGNQGKISVATWEENEYTFAISVSAGSAGLDNSTLRDMISTMNTKDSSSTDSV